MLPAIAVFLTMQASTSLDALRDLGDFSVTVSGPALRSFPSSQDCVYWEWSAGELKDGQWALRVGGAHSGTRLTVDTPRGRLDLAHGDMRLYLPAAQSHRYSSAGASSMPSPIRALVTELDPLIVQEFVLLPGRTYHARIDIETSLLPPRGDAPPERRRTLVLAVSDRPFIGGQAQRPLTPSFVGLSR